MLVKLTQGGGGFGAERGSFERGDSFINIIDVSI